MITMTDKMKETLANEVERLVKFNYEFRLLQENIFKASVKLIEDGTCRKIHREIVDKELEKIYEISNETIKLMLQKSIRFTIETHADELKSALGVGDDN